MPSAFSMPLNSCDCHAHVFGPFDLYPLAEDRLYTPPLAPYDEYRTMLAGAGMTRGVLVHAGACGWNHSGTLAALRAAGGLLRGVAVPHLEIGDNELADLHAAGFRGIRFTHVIGRTGGVRVSGTHDFDRIAHFAPKLRALGWHAALWGNAEVIASHATMLRALKLPLIIDHLSYVDVARGVADGAFQTVLELVRDGVAAVKLTAFRNSRNVPEYADVRPFHDALVAANPRQLVWGSDWPFLGMMGEKKPTVDGVTRVFSEWVGDASLREQILVHNPARLYGFD